MAIADVDDEAFIGDGDDDFGRDNGDDAYDGVDDDDVDVDGHNFSPAEPERPLAQPPQLTIPSRFRSRSRSSKL